MNLVIPMMVKGKGIFLNRAISGSLCRALDSDKMGIFRNQGPNLDLKQCDSWARMIRTVTARTLGRSSRVVLTRISSKPALCQPQAPVKEP